MSMKYLVVRSFRIGRFEGVPGQEYSGSDISELLGQGLIAKAVESEPEAVQALEHAPPPAEVEVLADKNSEKHKAEKRARKKG